MSEYKDSGMRRFTKDYMDETGYSDINYQNKINLFEQTFEIILSEFSLILDELKKNKKAIKYLPYIHGGGGHIKL